MNVKHLCNIVLIHSTLALIHDRCVFHGFKYGILTSLVMTEKGKDVTDTLLAVGTIKQVVDAPVPSHWVVQVSFRCLSGVFHGFK